ncbi:MAG TPA: carboxypeptidase regulatory-like domain-containing protein [Pyrinomonadaceae bacterium]|jgi:hypothetical protein|nr:carboxypeptidase regulatory-like domain-containing protein [Pyrinomonadaceae bacterium]
MKYPTLVCLTVFILLAQALAPAVSGRPLAGLAGDGPLPSVNDDHLFNLLDFGAVGDGITDNGPALQDALNAIAAAGGGTLFVPAGRYAINTPVQKDFTGLGASLTILGVESLTPVPPANADGQFLTAGLDLTSEFAPRTGEQGVAINITGLQTFLIKDITFIGTPGVDTDAAITLALADIWDATIRHCEFYGLSTFAAGGSIVQAIRSHLTIEQSEFLGDACDSGSNSSVVQNLEWKGIVVTNTAFADYGQRPELFGKLGLGTPSSWVSIANAAAPESGSPRREAVIRNVFFDEGALNGLSSIPYSYVPATAPIDLIYVSDIFMNVSNLGTSGSYFHGPQRVLAASSHYGWSHNAGAAINLLGIGNAILDQVECVDSANRIVADAGTSKLAVINSFYTFLDSQSPQTKVISTETPEDDPVQYVSQRFNATLERDPDAAAHFYWSDRLLQCDEVAACVASERTALEAYLNTAPVANFSIAGLVSDESGAGLPGVTITLGSSQSVTTKTGSDGRYSFDRLPTSGMYTVTPSRVHYTFAAPQQTITTPNGNRTADFAATLDRHIITVLVTDPGGNALAGVSVGLFSDSVVNGLTDSSGQFISALPAGACYTIVPEKQNYTFAPANALTGELTSNQTLSFVGRPTYTLSGTVMAHGAALVGATVVLSGPQSATATSDQNGNYSFLVLSGDNYTLTPAKTGYGFSPWSVTFNNLSANQEADFEGAESSFEFSAASYAVAEASKTITVTVNRMGDTSHAAEVVYSATDGSAEQSSDVIPIIGRLNFQPGEASKTFFVFVTDDSYVEGNEGLMLNLSDPIGADLGSSTAPLNITDDDSDPDAANPIDGAQFFVQQQYSDFLNRPADAEGLQFWSSQITSCGTDTACIAERRTNVSAAFFLSIEFQETGYLVYRLYRASFGQPPQHLNEFLLDTRTIGQGVVVNAWGWQELLNANRAAFIEDFVQRPQFISEYPLALTPFAFVYQLNVKAGGPLSSSEFSAAVAEFAGAATSEATAARVRVLRQIAESQTFSQRELGPAFVLMQYFGYLQRNPYDSPDDNLEGYNFWLNKLNEADGDFRRAEMVKSFLVSTEYRARFGAP